MPKLFELIGNMHMHTPYSDGEKWHKEIAEDAIAAGLDFLIVTDHNVWVDGVEGYYENENGRVLLLVGEEVHNPRRIPQASHFLVYGAEKEMSCYAANPQRLIDETNAAGGYGFLAHPHEKDVPIFDEPNLGWHDWDISDFTGLEIWNYMSAFKNRLAEEMEKLVLKKKLPGQVTAVRVALTPEKYMTGPEPETLALWDELLSQGKRVTAVGNSDAHGTPMSMGPIHRVIYPYEFLFRAVNTHVLTKKPLTGELEYDKRSLLQAIGRGHSWVGYDMAHPTKGFRFSGQGTNKIRHGQVVAEIEGETNLTHIPIEPGAYRAECYIPYQGKERGWIFSNPIYLR
jgi:hypothetical protein